MAAPKIPQISSRKRPQQARSTDLVNAILVAAAQVLACEGAGRFTTARVAEKAGVSIGSLYQYFPNKAAILFRLQQDEWQATSGLLQRILLDSGTPPADRLRGLVMAFIRSECDEADMRIALNDAAPLYRSAPEARAAKEDGQRVMAGFMDEVLPGLPEEERQQMGDIITTTLSAAGKQFSETPRTPEAITAWSNAMADMFCAWLSQKQARGFSGDATATLGA